MKGVRITSSLEAIELFPKNWTINRRQSLKAIAVLMLIMSLAVLRSLRKLGKGTWI
jgi:hypothetical protein